MTNIKIYGNDIKTFTDEPIKLFHMGIKSEETKEKYTRTLRRILCDILSNDILQGTFEERAKQFVEESKENPDWALNLLLTLSAKLRERTQLPKTDDNYLKPTSFGNYFKPVKKLLDTNRVPLVWETIYAAYPEQNDSNKGLGYSRQDIQKMLKFSKGIIDKAIILVSASSGIRRGGLVCLKWKDIRPVYQYQNKLLWDDADITESVTNDGKIVLNYPKRKNI